MSRSLNATSPSFIINSRYRDNLSDAINNFTYTMSIDSSKNYNCCALTSIRLPKSWYTIEASHQNNSFVLREGGVDKTITIPEGNYNINSMKYMLETLLNEASATAPANNWLYQVNYPDTFMQNQMFVYDFEVFKNTSQPSFIFSTDSRVIEVLGFDATTYTFVNNILVAPYTVQFELTNFVTIKSSICNNIGNQDSDTSVLAQIDCTHVRDGETIIYNIKTLEDATRSITSITQNTFTFSVYDDKDRPLNLFDDWNMSLLLYQHDYSSSFLINDIKLRHLGKDEVLEDKEKVETKNVST